VLKHIGVFNGCYEFYFIKCFCWWVYSLQDAILKFYLCWRRGNFNFSLTTEDHCHHHEILPVLGHSSWLHTLIPANPLVTHPSSEAW